MDNIDLKSLFLDQLLGNKAAPPPPYQYGPDQGPPEVDPHGNGQAPAQDWTPPEANQPGLIDRGLNAGKRFMRDAPGMMPDMPSAPNMEDALKAAEDAFNKVMQGGRNAAEAAEGAGRDLWNQVNPPQLQRPQPGQSPEYRGPEIPRDVERELSDPPYQQWYRPEFDEKKRKHRNWET